MLSRPNLVDRPVSEDHFGFMAYVDRGSAQDLPDLLDKGFQDASFVIERHVVHRPGEFARTYSHSSGWRLNCAGADGQSDSRPGWQGWPAWALLPIAHSQVVALPGNVLIDAIRVARDNCGQLHSRCGRDQWGVEYRSRETVTNERNPNVT